MKKTIFFLFLGSVVAGALLLAGVAYAFGAIAEAGVRQAVEAEPDEDAVLKWRFEMDDYARGFFSSETSSRMRLNSEPGAESEGDEGTPLRHVIYHGPLAMTPEGPKFCSYHVITTLWREKMSETVQESLVESFGAADPVTISTTAGFGGDQTTRVEVAAFSVDDEEHGSMKFDGATAQLATGPDPAFARGDFEIGAFNGTDLGFPGMEVEISPSSGSIDYVRGDKLLATLKLGALKGNSETSTFTMAASDGEIDWLKSTHLKGRMTLGAIESGDPEGLGKFVAGPGTLSTDLKRVSEAFDLLVGETKLHLEKVSLDSPGQKIAIDDFVIRADSGKKAGKLYGLIAYEVGGIEASESPDSPFQAGELVGKGFRAEAGFEGFDLATIEGLVEKASEISGLENMTKLSDFSDPEKSEQFGEALAENSEALSEYTHLFLDLIQPGLETYYTIEMRGANGRSGADVRIGMGGVKKLTEMKTAREILASLKGNATARISKTHFPPEEFTALIEDGPMAPYIAEHSDRFETVAELEDGKLYVNGDAIPLLDDLGPALDELIEWDAIFAGMAAGN